MLDFGVEIEFTAPSRLQQEDVAAVLTAAGIPTIAAGYSHATINRWKVVHDGSIRPGPGRIGLELVSPVLRMTTGFEVIKKVGEVLIALDAKVNRSTGLHVHFGIRHTDVAVLKRLAAFYVEHEELLDRLQPESRRASNNGFCQSNKARADLRQLARATSVNEIIGAVQGGDIRQEYRFSHTSNRDARRVKLNFQAYHKHGTVEFRHHAGTVNADRIIKWVTLTSKALELAMKDATMPVVAQTPASFWRKGRNRRALFQLLQRPEGVTAQELKVHLAANYLASIRWYLEKSNTPYFTNGRRAGSIVYCLSNEPSLSTSSTVTLEGLYEKLELSPEDRAFWAQRAAALASPNQTPSTNNLTMYIDPNNITTYNTSSEEDQ